MKKSKIKIDPVFGSIPKDNEVSCVELRAVYTQPGDCCGGEDAQELVIESHDGGGGMYIVIKTDRWALDGPSDLQTVIDDFYKRIKNE